MPYESSFIQHELFAYLTFRSVAQIPLEKYGVRVKFYTARIASTRCVDTDKSAKGRINSLITAALGISKWYSSLPKKTRMQQCYRGQVLLLSS